MLGGAPTKEIAVCRDARGFIDPMHVEIFVRWRKMDCQVRSLLRTRSKRTGINQIRLAQS